MSRCSRSVSHGSHDSMPSNSWPSASRSHCSRPHGCSRDQRGGALAHLVGGEQLAGREDARLGDVVGRALVGDRERREAVDLVAPEVDAHRMVVGRRVHVDDRAPHRDLAARLHLVLAPVPAGDQPGHQLVAVDVVAGADHDRLDLLDVRAEALHERAHRGDDDRGRRAGYLREAATATSPAGGGPSSRTTATPARTAASPTPGTARPRRRRGTARGRGPGARPRRPSAPRGATAGGS